MNKENLKHILKEMDDKHFGKIKQRQDKDYKLSNLYKKAFDYVMFGDDENAGFDGYYLTSWPIVLSGQGSGFQTVEAKISDETEDGYSGTVNIGGEEYYIDITGEISCNNEVGTPKKYWTVDVDFNNIVITDTKTKEPAPYKASIARTKIMLTKCMNNAVMSLFNKLRRNESVTARNMVNGLDESQMVTLSESKLRDIIKESTKKVLNEDDDHAELRDKVMDCLESENLDMEDEFTREELADMFTSIITNLMETRRLNCDFESKGYYFRVHNSRTHAFVSVSNENGTCVSEECLTYIVDPHNEDIDEYDIETVMSLVNQAWYACANQ